MFFWQTWQDGTWFGGFLMNRAFFRFDLSSLINSTKRLALTKNIAAVLLVGGAFALNASQSSFGQMLPEDGTDWTFADVRQLIKSQEELGQPIQSPDQLLQVFPKGLKSDFTFIFDSKAKFQGATPLHPRALVFNKRLLYTFNGHPSQSGYSAVEFMDFDEKKRSITLHEIEWDARGQAQFSKPNPSRCIECHGTDPKPLWTEYAVWPGVYGSSNDILRNQERTDYIAFLKNARDSKNRYSHLKFPEHGQTTPYQYRYPGGIANWSGRVNLTLTKLLTRMNALRTARLIEESPFYAEYQWLLPISFKSCDDFETLNAFDEHVQKAVIDRKTWTPPLATHLDRLMHLMGLPYGRVNMDRSLSTYDYRDGSQSFAFMLRLALLKTLAQKDTELASRIKFTHDRHTRRYDQKLYRWIDELGGDRLQVEGQPDYCDRIREHAQAKIAQGFKLPAAPAPGTSFGEKVLQAEQVRVSSAIPISCVYCHSVHKPMGTPHIAFDDLEKLKQQMLKDDGRLLKETLRRSLPDADPLEIMPPSNFDAFGPINQAQAKVFKTFLMSLEPNG